MSEDVTRTEDVLKRGSGNAPQAAVLVLLLAAVLGLEVWQALKTGTFPIDEPLWFRKAQALPLHVTDPDDRFYAVDVPGLNRWIYWPVFHITGLYKVPAGEPECWSLREGRIYFQGTFTNDRWPQGLDEAQFDAWVHRRGKYAPRSSIMALRFVNIAVYGCMLAAFWYTALLALKSRWLAVLAAAPVAIVPSLVTDIAFVTWSGDIFVLCMFAVTLAAWTALHLKGRAVSRLGVIVIGALCGLTVASKLTGVLVLFAYCAYLVIESRGLARVVNPIVAGAVAFAAFCVVDPVIFLYPDRAPWQVCALMVRRRMEVVAAWTQREGPLTWIAFCGNALFWWPMLPVAAWAFWKSRRRPWFSPLALWSAFVVIGTLVGIIQVNRADPEYVAPVYIGFFFPVAVALIALGVANEGPPEAPEEEKPPVAGG